MDILEHLAGSSGVILRREANAAQIDDNALHRLVRAKRLERIRQGAYALGERWRKASDVERHAMLCTAVIRQYGDHVMLSHVSAIAAFGGPTWNMDLSQVHVTHLSGGGRRGARIVHHEGVCRVNDLTRRNGRWITSPARTVLDVASIEGGEAGLMVANDLLHRGLVTRPELEQMATTQTRWPGSLRHHVPLHLADALVESPGESRCLWLFFVHGLPTPVLQYPVHRADGSLVGRVDFAWPDLRLLVEFDGPSKYLRYRRDGESVADVVMREKRREDEIRELTGCTMIRLVTNDIDVVPLTTIARLRSKMDAAAAA